MGRKTKAKEDRLFGWFPAMFLPQLGICKNERTNGGGRPPPLSSQSQLNTILRELRPLVMAQKESKLKSPS